MSLNDKNNNFHQAATVVYFNDLQYPLPFNQRKVNKGLTTHKTIFFFFFLLFKSGFTKFNIK